MVRGPAAGGRSLASPARRRSLGLGPRGRGGRGLRDDAVLAPHLRIRRTAATCGTGRPPRSWNSGNLSAAPSSTEKIRPVFLQPRASAEASSSLLPASAPISRAVAVPFSRRNAVLISSHRRPPVRRGVRERPGSGGFGKPGVSCHDRILRKHEAMTGHLEPMHGRFRCPYRPGGAGEGMSGRRTSLTAVGPGYNLSLERSAADLSPGQKLLERVSPSGLRPPFPGMAA